MMKNGFFNTIASSFSRAFSRDGMLSYQNIVEIELNCLCYWTCGNGKCVASKQEKPGLPVVETGLSKSI